MKTRNGFVSNSSSSSFIVAAYEVPENLRQKMLDMSECRIENNDIEGYGDSWTFELVTAGLFPTMQGYTHMDNGDLAKWFVLNGATHLVKYIKED